MSEEYPGSILFPLGNGQVFVLPAFSKEDFVHDDEWVNPAMAHEVVNRKLRNFALVLEGVYKEAAKSVHRQRGLLTLHPFKGVRDNHLYCEWCGCCVTCEPEHVCGEFR